MPEAFSDDALISLERVSFSYEGQPRPAVRDLNFQVGRGEFLGVIGPSGSGKTTLASILSGAIPHHYAGEFCGVARVMGTDSCEVGLTDISRRLGSVLQDIDAQMVASNVEDEMLYGLENFGVPHEVIPSRVSGALRACGVEGLARRERATLSGGQQQRLAIAAILALRPSIMVLDEPTAALDPASSRMVFETLRKLNAEEGITVVIIEQKVALLCEFCQRVAVMDEGRIAFLGSPREVFSHSRELRELGVDSPRVTRISNQLQALGLAGAADICLSVDEAEELISRIAGGSRVREGGEARPTPGEACLGSGGAPLLLLEDVRFSYPGGEEVLKGLSLELAPGELLAVVGENGAGKTTATKLMNGILKPSSGTVTIAGLDTRRARTSEIARRVSTLFQDPDRQICKESVVEEVAFSLRLLGVGETEALSRARDTVEHFGLPACAAPFSLGRGQRQIVALASVVVTNPQLLILDEPTSGLDYRECMVVMEAVEAAREQGCAVVMVCHDMEVVSDFATRMLVVDDGRAVADGLPHELFADEALMRRARVAAPQVLELSRRLSASVSRAFEGASEVSDVVSVTKGLVG